MSQELIDKIATHIRKLEDNLEIVNKTIRLDDAQGAAKRALRLARHETKCLHICLNQALDISGDTVSDGPVVYSGGQPKPDNPSKSEA